MAESARTDSKKARAPRLLRMHFRVDGRPKEALTPAAAGAARRRGKHTYLCPICGATHAGGGDDG